MRRLSTFEVFLLNQYGEVDCGSKLRGQVVLDCPQDVEVNEVMVQCYGRCHVQLVDFRMSAPLLDIHTGSISPPIVNEVYINKSITCFPIETQSENELEETATKPKNILRKGPNVFDFEFNIPSNTPPSFEGQHGHIRYIIRAIVQFPDRFECNIRTFKVLPILDLNCLLNVESIVEEEEESEMASFFKNIGKLKVKMSLPKRGYVPGDLLHVQLNIENNTIKDITRARLTLKMVTTYTMEFQKQVNESILAVSQLSPICAGYTFQGCDRNLRIPKDVIASHIMGCRYIHVKYCVELCIRPTLLCLKSLQLSTRLEVGTVPVSTERELASLMMHEPPPRYEDLPPSYYEAITYLVVNSCQQHITHEPIELALCSETGALGDNAILVEDDNCNINDDGSDDDDDDDDDCGDDDNDDCSVEVHDAIISADDTRDLDSHQQTVDILQQELETTNLFMCYADLVTVVIISNLDQVLSIVNDSSKSVFYSDSPDSGCDSKAVFFSRLVKLLQRLSPFTNDHNNISS